MKLTKVYYLDENYKYPKCNTCGKELSPFSVTSTELNECTAEHLKLLIKSQLLRLNGIEQDKHVIFLCKTCCDIQMEII